MFIYLIRNKVNGKVYVGQTTRSVKRRWSRHLSLAATGVERPLYKAIRKYGAEQFEIAVLGTVASKVDLDQAEQLYIYLYESNNLSRGYNLTSGGDSPIVSAETRKKLSEMRRGKPHSTAHRESIRVSKLSHSVSEEVRQAVRTAHKGKPLTEEHKAKLRGRSSPKGMLGRSHSDESRTKISEAAARMWAARRLKSAPCNA